MTVTVSVEPTGAGTMADETGVAFKNASSMIGVVEYRRLYETGCVIVPLFPGITHDNVIAVAVEVGSGVIRAR